MEHNNPVTSATTLPKPTTMSMYPPSAVSAPMLPRLSQLPSAAVPPPPPTRTYTTTAGAPTAQPPPPPPPAASAVAPPANTTAAVVGAAAVPPTSVAAATLGAPGSVVLSGRGNGLEYAQMRKEKAREEYKERRRLELLASGDVERTKRRKKNDTSMTENQKYHRRLKMNQDSAAAARHAQEVYIQTLESLVEVTESEKSVLSIQAHNLKNERDDLMRRVAQLQDQLNNAQRAPDRNPATDKILQQTQLDLKSVFDIMDNHGATEFRAPGGMQPARAV